MWSNLAKPLAIAALTVVLFVALVIGMNVMSQTGGEVWGMDHTLSPDDAAQLAFENNDFRLLGIRLMDRTKPRQQLILGAECWPESLNSIDYEVDFASSNEPESGAHKSRAEFATQYNLRMAALLLTIGRECKKWN